MFGTSADTSTSVKLIGIGGAGGNTAAAMRERSIAGTVCIVMNTDEASLAANPCREKVLLSQRDVMESRGAIKKVLKGSRLAILVAGMGGDAGTNATPVVAQTAKEMGIPVLCLVTLPMRFEGEKRMKKAMQGVKTLQGIADCVAVLHNEQLVGSFAGYTTIDQVVDIANDALYKVVERTAAIVQNANDELNMDVVRDSLQDSGYIAEDADTQ